MLASLSNKAILTKARAMYGSRLTAEDYRELTHKYSVGEAVAYLKNETPYRAALESISESDIHRNHVEAMLKKDLYLKYIRLARYNNAGAGGDNFYDYVWMRLEIEQILACLRLLSVGRMEEFITQMPLYAEGKLRFDLHEMSQVRSYDQLLKAVRRTRYYDILESFQPKEGRRMDYTSCEVAMRSYYYTMVDRFIDREFHGTVKKELQGMFDARVELKNICTVYRLKKYYGMTLPQIKEHLITYTSRIPLAYYDRIMDADVSDDGDRMLEHSRFRRYMDAGEWERDGNIENSTQRTMFRLTRQYIHFSNSPALVFAAYMFLSELEVQNIIDIIEGLHYKLPPEEIDSMLII